MFSKTIFVVQFILFSFLYGHIYAQEISPIDQSQKDCLKNKYTTTDISKCSMEVRDKWKEEIKKNYDLLMSALGDEASRQKLTTAQKAWEGYVEAEIKSLGEIYDSMIGSMWINAKSSEFTDLYKERALKLQRLHQMVSEEETMWNR